MERTYNVFVDNGLFVAANILDKKVEDVTINDLKNNTKLFGEKVYKFTTSDRYKKISSMSFHNSAFDQPAYRTNRKEKFKNSLV
ncbi:hypothetical protein CLCAR_3249 [Clostridium carboxidivorans P7]|uniref:hypothetical protein n=1 Tax=Clostridium carboxidivorans TaxID=217159 RepID=UPI0001D3938A|nr:hypothetical protein [Clostridium carboxidivorans]EFG87143.1 hypothetical protein CLCAR_3249 [Clostridium carboxidivorans P7]